MRRFGVTRVWSGALRAFLLMGVVVSCVFAQEVGKRPYELDWAGRADDDWPPLVDFEDVSGWRVETVNSEAAFASSREQQLWGMHVGRVSYCGTGDNPVVRLLPPEPVAIPEFFDAVTCWIYGNNISGRDKTTPPVTVSANFLDSAGGAFSVAFKTVAWKEWFLCHRRFSPDMIERVRDGGSFTGFTITNGRNRESRVLYFDNLAVFEESFPPLAFAPRAERGVRVFEGRDRGTNTGPGVLPFPTRPETIVPLNLTDDFSVSAEERDDAVVFRYTGPDGTAEWVVPTETCLWDGIRVKWGDRGDWIRPCVGGGIRLLDGAGNAAVPTAVELIERRMEPDGVRCRWSVSNSCCETEVAIHYWMHGKSLVVDLAAAGATFAHHPATPGALPNPDGAREGCVSQVVFGAAEGFVAPRLVTVPYYTYGQTVRPAAVVSGDVDAPLFFMGHIDWTLSNASRPWAENRLLDTSVTYNGGTQYVAKTDGRLNPCYERFVLALSPRFEEVLPTIPNPESPWKQVTGTRVWRAHGASDRERDAAYWRKVHRYGMRHIVVTDHETGWRDGEESFTFRTRPAPGKGGDEGQKRYARIMQDELGFVYGPYNNFTDFAPVNEYWDIDLISRTPESQLQTAWRRCYAPKPARAVEYCQKLAPVIEAKFGFSTAYCDVHTAVTPWQRTDYDYRVPGAGTFAAVYYAYGEIMLLQKRAWGGPVYSEGNNHFPYVGLTDGNYAQDQRYGPAHNPWLVDFDLLKMHDLCCNFGMGNIGMFFGRNVSLGRSRAEVDASIDRFLAATVAFGHTGFLVFSGGYHNALRSYYMLQQLHSRYALSSAERIRYVDEAGRLLETDAALATGAFRRSQVVTVYSGGCTTVANGSRTERLVARVGDRDISLPPNGYMGWTADGAVDVFSGELAGRRVDYAATPEYIYADGRGKFTRFARAASDGIGICRILDGGEYELIPYENSDCGFAVEASRAEALNESGVSLGPATVRLSRGLVYVKPVEDAFSYRLWGGPSSAPVLRCARSTVVPGEEVLIADANQHSMRIPADATPGTRLWYELDGGWIDFTVEPMCRIAPRVDGERLRVAVTSNLGDSRGAVLNVRGAAKPLELRPNRESAVDFPLPQATHEQAEILDVTVRAGDLVQSGRWVLTARAGYEPVAAFPTRFESGMCLRGEPEQGIQEGFGASVYRAAISCGGTQRSSIRMHPPYKRGVGYSFALFDPVRIPENACVFRAWVGKGDGSDAGDGITYRVAAVLRDGAERVLGEVRVQEHRWVPVEAELSALSGQSVRFKLITDVGPDDNSSGDWGCWADMRLETPTLLYRWQLADGAGPEGLAPAPFPVSGLTTDILRGAVRGVLHYDGMGLEGDASDRYRTFAVLNGIEVGPMAAAQGNAGAGQWAEDVTVPLTEAAIASLGMRNEFRLKNPAQDWFKVGRFWLELELADGRRCSTMVSTGVFTQPPNWPYAEGAGVPHGDDIRVDLWF